MDHSPEFLALCEEAKAQVQETTPEAVQARRDRGEGVRLIDVREDHEFAAGHIPGAEHLGRGIIERDIRAKHPDKDAELVLYCGGGFRSALAAVNLQKMGYTNIVSMDGGMRRWRELGYPEESGEHEDH
ncbi:MAG TPA: rhodanese-like domain-containing protein [bacterium]|nr:rhodanese-like domain-containing protein [bacterium]